MKLVRLAVLAALTLSTVACTKTSTKVGGGVLAVGGGLMLAAAVSMDTSCPENDPVCGVFVEPAAKTFQVGVGAVGVVGLVGGLALLAASSSMTEAAETHATRPPATLPMQPLDVRSPNAATTPTPTVAPPPAAPTVVAPTPAQEMLPAERAIRARPENQLALQASLIAKQGNCSAAVVTGKRLRELDAALYTKLVSVDAAFARCVAR